MSLFGLLSSLDSSKWHDSDTPPGKHSEMEGGTYNNYGVMNTTQRSDHMEYVLVPDKGDPAKGKLYGCIGDPMRGVSSCWFSLGKGNIIKGMAMDDDWVLMNDDCLQTLEAAVVESDEAPDMGLYMDLKTDKWSKKGQPPGGKYKLGYNQYDITQVDILGPGELEVHLATHSGRDQSSVKMFNVERNCFRSTPTCFLKITKGEITGVMTKDDWIELNR